MQIRRFAMHLPAKMRAARLKARMTLKGPQARGRSDMIACWIAVIGRCAILAPVRLSAVVASNLDPLEKDLCCLPAKDWMRSGQDAEKG